MLSPITCHLSAACLLPALLSWSSTQSAVMMWFCTEAAVMIRLCTEAAIMIELRTEAAVMISVVHRSSSDDRAMQACWRDKSCNMGS